MPQEQGKGKNGDGDSQSKILKDLWTPELKREFRDMVDGFFDAHPELREGASHALQEYWDSPEGQRRAEAMSKAQR